MFHDEILFWGKEIKNYKDKNILDRKDKNKNIKINLFIK
jgi:alpha-galactosidase